MKGLDQFYTSPRHARICYDILLRKLPVDAHSAHFIEPSAGDGVFYDLLPPRRRTGLDLEPRFRGLKQGDFLQWRPSRGSRENRVVIGNPPFGKRGDVALDFLLHAAEIADTVGFILPMSFRKFAIQKKLPGDLRLVEQTRLDRDAFRLPDGKPYAVSTEFQVWTRGARGVDLRRLRPEPISHPDFVMHQYNNTEQALHVFNRPFDFAVPCQGWQDYSRREKDAAKCEKHKQWMLLQGASGKIRRLLYGIDYGKLAMTVATSVPGFRKRDLVSEYARVCGHA